MMYRAQELLQSSQPEVMEEDDSKATPAVVTPCQNTMLLLATTEEVTTVEDGGDDEVDFAMLEATNISVQQTTITCDDDILNRAQKITLVGTSEILSRNAEDGDANLSNGYLHFEATEESSVTFASSSGISASNSSTVDNLHLELSQNDLHDDDEEPRSKPHVAETPLDVNRPLPTKYHDIPQFLEVQKDLGRTPTFSEYMAYRLDKISLDLECRYPELDKQFQQIISAFGNTLTYEVFQRAALSVQSQAERMYEGMFMVLRFGRQLFQNFPDSASSYTTRWVNEYIVHQGGWVSL